MMTKIDPYQHEAKYYRWKHEQGCSIPSITSENADLIRRFVFDMERGLNVSRASKRGPRSFIRLNTLRYRLATVCRQLNEQLGVTDVSQLTEDQLHSFVGDLRSGKILKQSGEPYRVVGDIVKDIKTFWHWYMEVQRRAGRTIPDIAHYLDTRKQKPRWVYVTENQVRELCNHALHHYRVLMMFLLDSGVRSPTELVNIRVRDFADDFSKVQVSDEASKTFGRRINLLLCPSLVRDFVRSKNLGPDDQVFPINPAVTNRYLKRLAKRVLGTGVSLAGERYDRLTLYDFRHVSACYWLPRYKSESALKYRFGWKQTERIHYYTELLGMRDTITEEDVLAPKEKTEVEQRLAESEREKALLQEQLDSLQVQMTRIAMLTEKLAQKVG